MDSSEPGCPEAPGRPVSHRPAPQGTLCPAFHLPLSWLGVPLSCVPLRVEGVAAVTSSRYSRSPSCGPGPDTGVQEPGSSLPEAGMWDWVRGVVWEGVKSVGPVQCASQCSCCGQRGSRVLPVPRVLSGQAALPTQDGPHLASTCSPSVLPFPGVPSSAAQYGLPWPVGPVPRLPGSSVLWLGSSCAVGTPPLHSCIWYIVGAH